VDFYQKHNPEKLISIDAILLKFRGREESLVEQLLQKYQSEVDEDLASSLRACVSAKINDGNETKPSPATANKGISTLSSGMQDISANLAASFLNGVGWSKNQSQATPTQKKEYDSTTVLTQNNSNEEITLLNSKLNNLQAEYALKEEELLKAQSTTKKMHAQVIFR